MIISVFEAFFWQVFFMFCFVCLFGYCLESTSVSKNIIGTIISFVLFLITLIILLVYCEKVIEDIPTREEIKQMPIESEELYDIKEITTEHIIFDNTNKYNIIVISNDNYDLELDEKNNTMLIKNRIDDKVLLNGKLVLRRFFSDIKVSITDEVTYNLLNKLRESKIIYKKEG